MADASRVARGRGRTPAGNRPRRARARRLGAEENAREVVDPVAEAADRTVAAGGARIDGAALFQVQGQEVEATIRGIVDFDDERSRIRMRFPGLSAQE